MLEILFPIISGLGGIVAGYWLGKKQTDYRIDQQRLKDVVKRYYEDVSSEGRQPFPAVYRLMILQRAGYMLLTPKQRKMFEKDIKIRGIAHPTAGDATLSQFSVEQLITAANDKILDLSSPGEFYQSLLEYITRE